VFVAEQLLKKHDLSDEEISSGIVDGGDDGGIDGFFTFVNDELLQEDTELTDFAKKGVKNRCDHHTVKKYSVVFGNGCRQDPSHAQGSIGLRKASQVHRRAL
jgi:hypothetical protein